MVRSIIKLRKILKPSTLVYMCTMINYLYFVQKRNIRIIYEQTENPDIVSRIGGVVFNIYICFMRKRFNEYGVFL